MTAPTLVVRITEAGEHEYFIFGSGDCRFLIVDENCPDDRVYALTVRSPRHKLDELIGDSPIGSMTDDRHPALANRIGAAARGEPYLRAIDVEEGKTA